MVTLRHIMKEVVKEELPFENMDSAEKTVAEKAEKADSAVRRRYGNAVRRKRTNFFSR